jgi:hypothetical protein
MAKDTFHHWRVFADKSDGVCIQFKHNSFDRMLRNHRGNIRAGGVKYKKVKVLRRRLPAVEELPFLKRLPYSDEREFRLCYIEKKSALKTKDFQINLESILRITLSPRLSKNQAAIIRKEIHSIPGCKPIKVSRSTLLENEDWKRAAVSAK